MSEAMKIDVSVGVAISGEISSSRIRRISLIEEDSRECPTQEANEMERSGNCIWGVDERRGLAQGLQGQMLNRIDGLRRHHQTLRERRDSNSFDSFDDSESDDEFVIHRKLLRRRHVRKYQLQKEREQKQKQLVAVAAAVEAARRNNLAASNKRKSPSRVVGEDPPKASREATVEESMSIDEDDDEIELETDSDTSFDDSTSFDPSPETYAEYNTTLPAPARRISLSPVSRSLAFQFDSISFFSPMRPSQPKRRKVRDTSITA